MAERSEATSASKYHKILWYWNQFIQTRPQFNSPIVRAKTRSNRRSDQEIAKARVHKTRRRMHDLHGRLRHVLCRPNSPVQALLSFWLYRPLAPTKRLVSNLPSCCCYSILVHKTTNSNQKFAFFKYSCADQIHSVYLLTRNLLTPSTLL